MVGSTLGMMAETVEWFSAYGLLWGLCLNVHGYWFTTCYGLCKTQCFSVCVCLLITLIVCSAVSHHVWLIVVVISYCGVVMVMIDCEDCHGES